MTFGMEGREEAERAAAARVQGAPLQPDAWSHCHGTRLEHYLRYVIDRRGDSDRSAPALRCPRCDNFTLRYDPKYMAIA